MFAAKASLIPTIWARGSLTGFQQLGHVAHGAHSFANCLTGRFGLLGWGKCLGYGVCGVSRFARVGVGSGLFGLPGTQVSVSEDPIAWRAVVGVRCRWAQQSGLAKERSDLPDKSNWSSILHSLLDESKADSRSLLSGYPDLDTMVL